MTSLIRVPSFMRDFAAYSGGQRLATLLGLMLFGGLVEGLSLSLLVPLLVLVTGGGGGGFQDAVNSVLTSVGAARPLPRLALIILSFIALMALRGVVLLARDRSIASLNASYVEHRRLQLLEAVARARWCDVAGLRHARVTSALAGETTRVAAAAQSLMQLQATAIMLVAQLAVTLAISPLVGLLTTLLLCAAGALSIRRLRTAERLGERIRHSGLTQAHIAGQLLGGLKQAAAENRQEGFILSYAATGDELVQAQIRYQRRATRFNFAVSVGAASGGGIVLLVGFWLGISSGALIAVMLILSRMAGPAVGLHRSAEVLATTLPAHRMIEQLRQELCRSMARGSDIGEAPVGDIVFDRVTYRYDGHDVGVSDISFTVNAGDTIGLMGPSGAGKTTLVDLMVGLLTPQSGSILIGSIPLDETAAAAWRERVAYVGQDAFLDNETIRTNLVPRGRPALNDDVLWNALSLVRVADAIRAMPDGLDTKLNERGSRLSGGERQRVALARAILRQPALLILDEATNAIDIDTEHRILSAVIAADPAATIVIVAHRNETLRHCNRIVVLDQGRLVSEAPWLD